jgi:hypothetical protein
MCLLHKQNIKQVNKGSVSLSGEIGSPRLAIDTGALLACFSVTEKSSFTPSQAPL